MFYDIWKSGAELSFCIFFLRNIQKYRMSSSTPEIRVSELADTVAISLFEAVIWPVVVTEDLYRYIN